MRRLCLFMCLVGAVGCRGGFENRILGKWTVDPTSVTTTRLISGTDKKTDWTNATKALTDISVQFTPSAVTATGLGGSSSGTWKLNGANIRIDGGKETWPDMVFDVRGPRIHTTLVKGADTVQMDLVKGH